MNTWIFQGNPKHFDMDTYLTENEHITWSVRQKYLADQMQVGDIVFIWRSDGGKKAYISNRCLLPVGLGAAG